MNHKQGWASGAMRRNAFAFLTRQERRKYEIARELGITTKTVEYHIRTALAELRKIIAAIIVFF